MGWFDEQIRMRKQSDQEAFEDAFVQIAGAVLGTKTAEALDNDRLVAKNAIEEILKYYHCKPGRLPDTITEFEDQLEYLLRPHGLMRRNVKLKKGWYHEAFGPMIGVLKESQKPVALLPSGLNGYSYKDPETGMTCRLNRKREKLLEARAISFYYPFPLRKLKIPDLFKYMGRCLSIRDGILVLILMFVMRLLGMFLPVLTRTLIGPVSRSGDLRILAGISVFLVCLTITNSIMGVIESMVSERFSRKMELQVEAATMMRVLMLPPEFFRKYNSGEISSRMGSLNDLCRDLFNTVLYSGISSLLSLMYVTQIFHFAPSLVIPALVSILSTVVISTVATFWQTKISTQQMEWEAKNTGLTYSLITGVQKIRLAGAEKRAFSKWAEQYSHSVALEYSPPMFLRLNSVIVGTIGTIATIFFYYQAVRSHMSMENYVAFNTAYGMLSSAFSSLAGITLIVSSIKPVVEMAEPILNAVPEASKKKEILTELQGEIELNHISFRYSEETPWILEDLSLKIHKGEYVAIVGYTGCGKSTLLRILLGFEKPQRGAVYYDNRNLDKLDLRSVRRKIGTVIQNGSLFQGDIYSNITICAPWLPMEAAWEAAEAAGIADDIRAMPMGMQTVISAGQGGISGGQKQRLMIARAIAPKPKILMFDEATSALDNKTQKQVSEALEALHCTRIVIAHRLSTVRNCDRILVLDQGHIVESGSYDELIAKDGFFAELVKRQRVEPV